MCLFCEERERERERDGSVAEERVRAHRSSPWRDHLQRCRHHAGHFFLFSLSLYIYICVCVCVLRSSCFSMRVLIMSVSDRLLLSLCISLCVHVCEKKKRFVHVCRRKRYSESKKEKSRRKV